MSEKEIIQINQVIDNLKEALMILESCLEKNPHLDRNITNTIEELEWAIEVGYKILSCANKK